MNAMGVNTGAGGPVGGAGMMMMNNGSPANQPSMDATPEHMKAQLNTYIYEYILKLGLHDVARAMAREGDKFKIRTASKQSPGRKKDGEVNGVDDAMDLDMGIPIPDDIPRPSCPDSNPGRSGFLYEWFSIFSDIFSAHSKKGTNMGPAAQYLMHHQNMQRMRENGQNANMVRPGMMNPNYAMRAAGMRNGMVNGTMQQGDVKARLTPQQMQMMQQQRQQQIQREQGGDVEMNGGRPGSPAEGENGASPSKRPRLDNPQFNNGMMPNGRPNMQGQVQQGMMIQNGFNPNMPNQFRQNGNMPNKPMQPMPNGMMNMGNNAGSPMMPGINPGQFGDNMAIEMFQSGRMAQPMQGGGPTAQSGNHALQDYQMQLMLLEQQNKKRLMMARQEQDNAVNRDGAPMPVGMGGAGMSPSGSRSGASPNPSDQINKRNPQLGGLPGSPSAGDLQGRSPGMNFMNGMPSGDFNPAMFMGGDKQGMGGPGGPNMRPPTSMDINNMARQQGRMGNQFQGGQPMVQNPSQGGGQPMGTPGQRNEMPPPQAPAGGSAQRNQPSSPAAGNVPPTPSQTSKANPKGKKGKDESNAPANKKKPAKKNSTVNAAADEPPTPNNPSTPITPQHNNNNQAKGQANMANTSAPQAPMQPMPSNQQMQQPDMSQQNGFDFTSGENFNLDFSTLDNTDVLENFDFDSFLNTTTDDAFNFDSGMIGGDFGVDAGND